MRKDGVLLFIFVVGLFSSQMSYGQSEKNDVFSEEEIRELLIYGRLTNEQVRTLVLGGRLGEKHLQVANEVLEDEKISLELSRRHLLNGISDKTQEGWKLLEDVPFNGEGFSFELVNFMQSGEVLISGNQVRERAIKINANLGQGHAEYLVMHQGLIPKRWRGEHQLVFPGTVWLDQDGHKRVPFLRWGTDYWFLDWHYLDRGWFEFTKLVRIKK